MTKPTAITRIGDIEYCLFNAEGDCPAYASVHRYLITKKLPFVQTSQPKCRLRIEAEIHLNGIAYPVTEISQRAFYESDDCNVFIPDSVVIIRREAFFKSNVASITGCNGVRIIEADAFFECTQLDEPLRFKAVEHIGAEAFAMCYFKKMVLPESLIDIDFSALTNCYALKSLSIFGSTRILEKEDASYYPGVSPITKIRLKAPFTQLRKLGRCIVSADKCTLFHINNDYEDNILIPGCIIKTVGNPFEHLRCASILFRKSKSRVRLRVDLGDSPLCTTIECHRPVTLCFEEILQGTLTVHCYSDVTICTSRTTSKDLNIICYKGGTVSFQTDLSLTSEPEVEYSEDCTTIENIMPGKTIAGPNVKTVKRISAYISFDNEPAGITHTVYLKSTTPPEVAELERGVMRHMELHVPKGCVPTYAKHKKWQKAEYITDDAGMVIDRSVASKASLRKANMLENIAISISEKYAMMRFGDDANVSIDGNGISLSVCRDIDSLTTKSITFRKYLSYKDAANPDIWDALEGEINETFSLIGI